MISCIMSGVFGIPNSTCVSVLSSFNWKLEKLNCRFFGFCKIIWSPFYKTFLTPTKILLRNQVVQLKTKIPVIPGFFKK